MKYILDKKQIKHIMDELEEISKVDLSLIFLEDKFYGIQKLCEIQGSSK